MLPMLYSAALLAPIPFGLVRIGVIVVVAAASFALAYVSGSRFKNSKETKSLRFKQVIVKPPFIVWLAVVAIITFQFASDSLMIYLANKK
jgi:uncharacterized membrane-anchored protein